MARVPCLSPRCEEVAGQARVQWATPHGGACKRAWAATARQAEAVALRALLPLLEPIRLRRHCLLPLLTRPSPPPLPLQLMSSSHALVGCADGCVVKVGDV